MSATFLSVVGRMLRLNGIIRGDTDVPTSFSDTQHNASLNLAIVAAQDELTYLISDRLITGERRTSGVISCVNGTRTYALASDFIRFYGTAHFYSATQNRQIYEYSGGLEQLQTDYFNYATATGNPNWWYQEPGVGQTVGFFQVPNLALTLTYDYEGSVLMTLATDTTPFSQTEEDYMFTSMAARRFKYLFEDTTNAADIAAVLEKDRTWISSKAALISLLKGRNPTQYYGRQYG